MIDRLLDDAIKDDLFDLGLVKTASTVLRESRRIGDFISQTQTKKPAISDINLNLPHDLALGANAKQIADKQHFEEQNGIEGRTTIIRGVEVFGFGANK